MSLLSHLDELRSRILRSLAAVGIAFLACWAFAKPIFRFLSQPVYEYLPEGQRLVFLGIVDPFFLYIKVALLAAIFAASPIVLYQIWRFISPGLYRKEKRYATSFVFFGSLLFMAGGAFAYYVAFPFAVEFLMGMGEDFDPAITGAGYLRFLMTVILGLGLMFELPLVILFLAKIGLVTPRFLMRHFRWAVIIIFIVAALITPTPDVFNLCLFALPTLALYLVGVALAAIVTRKKTRDDTREDEGPDEEPTDGS